MKALETCTVSFVWEMAILGMTPPLVGSVVRHWIQEIAFLLVGFLGFVFGFFASYNVVYGDGGGGDVSLELNCCAVAPLYQVEHFEVDVTGG